MYLPRNDSILPNTAANGPYTIKALKTAHPGSKVMPCSGIQGARDGAYGAKNKVRRHEEAQVDIEGVPSRFAAR